MKLFNLLITLFCCNILLTGCGVQTGAFKAPPEISVNKTEAAADKNNDNYIIIRSDDLSQTVTELDNGLLLSLHNITENTYYNITPLLVYYDKEDNVLDYSSYYINILMPGSTYSAVLMYPYTDNGAYGPFDHYEIQYKAILSNSVINNYSQNILVTANNTLSDEDTPGIYAKLSNQSDKLLGAVHTYALFYKAGKVIGCSENSVYNFVGKSIEMLQYSPPYDRQYNPMPFDSYKVIVNAAVISDPCENIPDLYDTGE